MPMSTTAVTYPQVGAVKAAEQILGEDRTWNPVNPEQRRFLREFVEPCQGEIARIPEIESLASWEANDINAFLKKKGFSIVLQPFGPDEFGVASVLDLLVQWLEKGEVTSVRPPFSIREFPAVRMREGVVQFWRAPNHRNPIAQLATKSGDEVYLTMLDNPPTGFDLVARAQEFSRMRRPNHDFEGLIFPMVDLDQMVDISWLIGMGTTAADGQPAVISQALQKTKLRMNEVGARAQSAVALSVARSSRKPPKPRLHIINRPFLVWFERKGFAKPLFVGHITEEDWKRPKEL